MGSGKIKKIQSILDKRVDSYFSRLISDLRNQYSDSELLNPNTKVGQLLLTLTSKTEFDDIFTEKYTALTPKTIFILTIVSKLVKQLRKKSQTILYSQDSLSDINIDPLNEIETFKILKLRFSVDSKK